VAGESRCGRLIPWFWVRVPDGPLPGTQRRAYARPVKKQTSILLDVDLVREVGKILGTESISDTVHALLEERARQAQATKDADRDDDA
jgi:Arc/MetJ family transcription regulator